MMILNTFSLCLSTPVTISHVSLEEAFSLSDNRNVHTVICAFNAQQLGEFGANNFFLFANIIWLSPQMKFKMKCFGSPHQHHLAIVPCWFHYSLIIYRLTGLKGTWQAYLIQWFLNLAEHQHLMGNLKKYRFLGIKPH